MPKNSLRQTENDFKTNKNSTLDAWNVTPTHRKGYYKENNVLVSDKWHKNEQNAISRETEGDFKWNKHPIPNKRKVNRN